MSSSGTTKKEQRALRANSGNSLFSLVLVDRTYRFSSELDIKSKSVPVFPLNTYYICTRYSTYYLLHVPFNFWKSEKRFNLVNLRLLLVPTLSSCFALHSTASSQRYESNSSIFCSSIIHVLFKVLAFYPLRPQKVSMSHVTETVMEYPRITLCSPAFFTKER